MFKSENNSSSEKEKGVEKKPGLDWQKLLLKWDRLLENASPEATAKINVQMVDQIYTVYFKNWEVGETISFKIPRIYSTRHPISIQACLHKSLDKKFSKEAFVFNFGTIVDELMANLEEHGWGETIEIVFQQPNQDRVFFSARDEARDIFKVKEVGGKNILTIESKNEEDRAKLNEINQKINAHFVISKKELSAEEQLEKDSEYLLISKGDWELDPAKILEESGRGWAFINRFMGPTDKLVVTIYKDGTTAIGIDMDRIIKRE